MRFRSFSFWGGRNYVFPAFFFLGDRTYVFRDVFFFGDSTYVFPDIFFLRLGEERHEAELKIGHILKKDKENIQKKGCKEKKDVK